MLLVLPRTGQNTGALRDAGRDQGQSPQAALAALLSRQDIWGAQLPAQAAWRARVAHWHARVLQRGVDAALQELLA